MYVENKINMQGVADLKQELMMISFLALSSQLSALSSQLSALSSQLSALSSQLSAFSY
jgi:hypothetical protein